MSKQKSPPFVMIERSVLDSPAWRAMSHGARSLYLALRRRYNRDFHNNGKIYLSVRNAAIEIGSHRDQICRWFHELQHFGFIVMMKPGNLGLNGAGRAAHWRLTELGYLKKPVMLGLCGKRIGSVAVLNSCGYQPVVRCSNARVTISKRRECQIFCAQRLYFRCLRRGRPIFLRGN